MREVAAIAFCASATVFSKLGVSPSSERAVFAVAAAISFCHVSLNTGFASVTYAAPLMGSC
jgi:hypothetical protein